MAEAKVVRHEVVGKDWAVINVITRLCQKFGIGCGQGVSIQYREIVPGKMEVRAKVVSWGGGWISFEIQRDMKIGSLWFGTGMLTICIPDRYFDRQPITCGFTGRSATFQINLSSGDYGFVPISGYDGQCHCRPDPVLELAFL